MRLFASLILLLAIISAAPAASAQLHVMFYDSSASGYLPPQMKQMMALNPVAIHIRMKVNGAWVDTLVSRLDLSRLGPMGQNLAQPVYLGGTPLQVANSSINGVALHTDSVTSYAAGDTIAFAFRRFANTGQFAADFKETVYGSYVNNCAANSNTVLAVTPHGVVMLAKAAIGPNTEICADYQELINLFNNEPSLVRLVRYW